MNSPHSPKDQELLRLIQESDLQSQRIDRVYELCKRWKDGTNGERPSASDMGGMLSDIAQLPEEKLAVCRQAIVDSGFLGRRALEKRLRQLAPERHEASKADKTNKSVYCARFKGLVDMVEDQGRVRYLIRRHDGGLDVADSVEREGKTLIPPLKEHLDCLLPDVDNVKAAYLTDTPGQLFSDLVQYHDKISQLPSQAHLLLLAAWVFSTYRQEVLPFSGYLAFYNVAGRGKTRTGKGLIYVAYRGTHTVTCRESNLFRLSQDLQASIFFDVMDLSRKLAKNESEDILLQRFEKGATVKRTLFPEKGAFEDTRTFEIFGPTIIATNVALHKILDTRCFPISMPYASKHYPAPDPAEGLKFRERLVAWRAKRLFEPLADPGKVMAGRLGDIAMPLRSILQEVKPEAIPSFDSLITEMQESSRQDKAETLEARFLRIVKALSLASLDREIPIADIAQKLNQGVQEDSKAYLSSTKVGKVATRLGFKRGRSSQSRHIRLDKNFEAMCAEYGVEDTPTNLPEVSQVSQCHSSTEGNSDTLHDTTDPEVSQMEIDGEVTL